MKKVFALSLVLAVVAVACSKKSSPSKTIVTTTSQTPPTVVVVDAPKASPVPATEMVAAGKTVYEGKCNRCHGLKNTADYTADRWDGILRSMAPKAHLSDIETQQVTAYVKANAHQ
jgi:cytochrome c5